MRGILEANSHPISANVLVKPIPQSTRQCFMAVISSGFISILIHRMHEEYQRVGRGTNSLNKGDNVPKAPSSPALSLLHKRSIKCSFK